MFNCSYFDKSILNVLINKVSSKAQPFTIHNWALAISYVPNKIKTSLRIQIFIDITILPFLIIFQFMKQIIVLLYEVVCTNIVRIVWMSKFQFEI